MADNSKINSDNVNSNNTNTSNGTWFRNIDSLIPYFFLVLLVGDLGISIASYISQHNTRENSEQVLLNSQQIIILREGQEKINMKLDKFILSKFDSLNIKK